MDLCGYASDDELLFSSSTNGGAELWAVPSVDFTVAPDNGCVGMHVQDFLRGRTIGTWKDRAAFSKGSRAKLA